MASEILVNAKAENQEALNIILESATAVDRTFPSVGTGAVTELKVSISLVGYNKEGGSNTTVVDNKLVWGTFGSGISSREQFDNTATTEQQGGGAVLYSTSGFIKNQDATWTALKSLLKLDAFPNQLLIDQYTKTKSRLHRVFFVDDIQDIVPYVQAIVDLYV